MIQVTKVKSTPIEVGYLGYPECYVQHCLEPAVERVRLAITREGKEAVYITVDLCERCRMKDGDQLWRGLLPR